MSEVAGEAGAPGAEAAGEAGAAGGGGAAAAPEWLTALPEDLKGDATLSRYQDVEALARGHVEARKVASSRVVLPGADADETAWGAFFDAAGRPKDAAGYEIPLPEGDTGAFADVFKPVAHKLGFLPQQAKGLAEWWNGYQAELVTAENAASKAEVDGLAKEMGADFEPKLTAAKSLIKSLGIDPATADALDIKLGSANLLKIFMGLADRAGEHGRVDGGDSESLTGVADPDAAIAAKFADAAWRQKYNAGDVDTVNEYGRLLAAAQKKAMRGGPQKQGKDDA